jgi:hypothetical protein
MKFAAIFIFSLIFSQDFTYDVTLPEVSQRASSMQRVGITDITITYSRPYVRDREVWGKLVQFGMRKAFNGNTIPWRAGANENTTISFTHDVMIGSKSIPAGTYGMFFIVNSNKWTLILSKNSTSWGSYYYDETEDQARIDLIPTEHAHTELLTYHFTDVKRNQTTLTFMWEKIKVNIPIIVDVDKHIIANFRNELRGLNSFGYRSWYQAANYCLQNKVNYEEALKWIDQSIRQKSMDINNKVKGELLIAMGKEKDALPFLNKAFELSNNDRLKKQIQSLIDRVK